MFCEAVLLGLKAKLMALELMSHGSSIGLLTDSRSEEIEIIYSRQTDT